VHLYSTCAILHSVKCSSILHTNKKLSAAKRLILMAPLLNASIKKLQEQDLKKMFLDAVTENVDFFKQLGRFSLNGNCTFIDNLQSYKE